MNNFGSKMVYVIESLSVIALGYTIYENRPTIHTSTILQETDTKISERKEKLAEQINQQTLRLKTENGLTAKDLAPKPDKQTTPEYTQDSLPDTALNF